VNLQNARCNNKDAFTYLQNLHIMKQLMRGKEGDYFIEGFTYQN